MTTLRKPVTRRVSLDPRLGPKAAGEISVTLYPDASIGFRKLKSRSEVRLPLSSIYSMALKADTIDKQRQKALARKAKRITL